MPNLIKLLTRHNPKFDIFTHPIDPAQSRNNGAFGIIDYAGKVLAFYKELGVESALWTVHETQQMEYVTPRENYEYSLLVDETRIIAYVNEQSWSDYLTNLQPQFDYSTAHNGCYKSISLLVATPILPTEVIERQILKPTDAA